MGFQFRAKRSKHGNTKIVVDGKTFDSKREYSRYCELCLLEKHGVIKELKHQVAFPLAPSVKIEGENRARPALKYTADFTYKEGDKFVVEDSKSPHLRKTDTAYRIRKHLMMAVHGISVMER